MILKNGVGDGVLARVYKNHHLATQSIAEPAIGYKSRSEQLAFSMPLPFPNSVSNTEAILMAIYNGEADRDFVVNTLFISHSGGTTYNRHVIGRMYKNVTAPTTGILTGASIAFGNLNIGSTKITSVKAFLWDGSTGTGLTGGAAGSVSMTGIFPPQFTTVELNGSVILSPGQTVAFSMQSLEAAATSVCFTVSGYLSTKDVL